MAIRAPDGANKAEKVDSRSLLVSEMYWESPKPRHIEGWQQRTRHFVVVKILGQSYNRIRQQ